MLEKILSLLKQYFKKKENAYFMHDLLLLDKPERMFEPYILRHNGKKYLIINSDYAEPILYGRMTRNVKKKSFFYTSKIRPAHSLPYSEQAEIKNVLSSMWSDNNLYNILRNK